MMACIALRSRQLIGSVFLRLLTSALLLLTCLQSPSYSEGGKATVLPVIKAKGENSGERLYLPVVKVGNLKTDIPLLLDSGSSSTSIDCRALFSEEVCKTGKIRQKDIKGSGLRVTNTMIKERFESVLHDSQLAYAKLAFGSVNASVETESEVPFLIRLRERDRKTGSEISTSHKGVVGISPFDTSKVRADAVSAFRAINLGKGLKRGIILYAAGSQFEDCIEHLESCGRKPLLQVGLREEDFTGFEVSKAKRLAPRWPFATTDACLSFGKNRVCKATLIDTGSVKSIIAADGPGNADELSGQEELVVESKSLGDFKLKAEGRRSIVFDSKLPFHVLGITFFMTHDYLIDYERNAIGVSASR